MRYNNIPAHASPATARAKCSAGPCSCSSWPFSSLSVQSHNAEGDTEEPASASVAAVPAERGAGDLARGLTRASVLLRAPEWTERTEKSKARLSCSANLNFRFCLFEVLA